MKNPTQEQTNIIEEKRSCVVIARPGSGKTFTLSVKIAKILEQQPWYKGVVAISYTKKASEELKNRTLNIVSDKKSSFFGTIDKFCLSEITIPFMRQIVGIPAVANLKVTTIDNSGLSDQHKLYAKQQLQSKFEDFDFAFFKNCYLNGEVYLDLSGRLALYMLHSFKTIQRYLKARYSHLIIDEYQDSGYDQHAIFLLFKKLGITTIAVGDIDQSIYEFAAKSSKYLLDLNSRDDFVKYSLTLNHRCHPSISMYASKFISPQLTYSKLDGNPQVYHKRITGSEVNVADWISQSIPELMKRFSIHNNSDIAILVRGGRTAKLIQENIKGYTVQVFENTPLDESQSKLAIFWADFLLHFFSKKLSLLDLLEKSGMDGVPTLAMKRTLLALIQLKRNYHLNRFPESNLKDYMVLAGKMFFPDERQEAVLPLLEQVLQDQNLLKFYMPTDKNSLTLMTIHKSKGLEFDAVFHLDLHQTIIPSYAACVDNDKNEQIQSMNLHYVAITRAKQACILVSSTQRTNNQGRVFNANLSEYILNRQDLSSLRKEI